MLNFTAVIWMGIPGTRAKEVPVCFNDPYVFHGVSFRISWWNLRSPLHPGLTHSRAQCLHPLHLSRNSKAPYHIGWRGIAMLVFSTLILLTNSPKVCGCWCWQLALAREKPQSSALTWKGESFPHNKAPRHPTSSQEEWEQYSTPFWEKDHVHFTFLSVYCYHCSILLLVTFAHLLLCLIYKSNAIVGMYA